MIFLLVMHDHANHKICSPFCNVGCPFRLRFVEFNKTCIIVYLSHQRRQALPSRQSVAWVFNINAI